MSGSFASIRPSQLIGPACRERFLAPEDCDAVPGLALGGSSRLRPPYHMTRPRPDFALVLATVGGRGRYRDVAGSRRLEAGDLLVLPVAHPHAYGIAGDSWDIVWLHGDAGLSLPGRQGLQHDPVGAGELAALMELVLACPAAERRRHHLQALPGWLAGLGRGERDPDPELSELWRQVDKHLAAPWTVAEFCRRLGCSRPVLHRRCHAAYGRPPSRQLAHLRMDRARQLLLATDSGLRGIAAQLGYGNEFAFSVAFKRCWGCSPDALRRRVRSGGQRDAQGGG